MSRRGYDRARGHRRSSSARPRRVHRFLGLGSEGVLASFGYAATTAAGLARGPADVRASVAGLASSDGVWAALLAGKGCSVHLGPSRGPSRAPRAGIDVGRLRAARLGPRLVLEPRVASPSAPRSARAEAHDELAALDGVADVGEIVVATEARARTQ